MQISFFKFTPLASFALFASLSLASDPVYGQDAGAFPHAPVLISFEGQDQLAAAASRQGMLSQVLRYTLIIDETGKPVECGLSRDFRRKATEIALCRPLLRHMTFEPARNGQGQAIPGTFSGVIDFNMWMKQDGYLEPHVRN